MVQCRQYFKHWKISQTTKTFRNSVVVIKSSLLCFQVQCMQFSLFALPSIVKWRQCLKKYKGHICSNFFIQFVYKVSNFKAILMSNDLKSCKSLMKKEDVTLNKINCPSRHRTCTYFFFKNFLHIQTILFFRWERRKTKKLKLL